MDKDSSYDWLHSQKRIQDLDELDKKEGVNLVIGPDQAPERTAEQMAQANRDLQDAKKKADKKKALEKIAPGIEVGTISVDESVLENRGMEAKTNDEKEEDKEDTSR